ncbi:MAG: AAA family ATPase [Bacteroidota bacterium]
MNNVNAAKSYGILTARTFNQSLEDAKNQKVPFCLFGVFIYENEITILFSDTNTGKTILAIQICQAIASGIPIHPDFAVECLAQIVLYLDFEMTDKQLEKRYSRDWQDHFSFSDNLIRATIDYDFIIPDNQTLSDSILAQVNSIVQSTKAKVIVIDNLTYLNDDFEKSKAVLPLMRLLKKLKTQLGITFIILAHTPKIPQGQPISINHLAGSKQLANFIDAAFAVGRVAKDEKLRYIKQVKTRSEMIYHSDNVPVFEIKKIHNDNFLAFDFLERYENEYKLLEAPTTSERESDVDFILSERERGQSFQEIAKELGISKTTAYRIFQKNKDI